jgi:hypothetical protein
MGRLVQVSEGSPQGLFGMDKALTFCQLTDILSGPDACDRSSRPSLIRGRAQREKYPRHTMMKALTSFI